MRAHPFEASAECRTASRCAALAIAGLVGVSGASAFDGQRGGGGGHMGGGGAPAWEVALRRAFVPLAARQGKKCRLLSDMRCAERRFPGLSALSTE
jgi:hypothetical protein